MITIKTIEVKIYHLDIGEKFFCNQFEECLCKVVTFTIIPNNEDFKVIYLAEVIDAVNLKHIGENFIVSPNLTSTQKASKFQSRVTYWGDYYLNRDEKRTTELVLYKPIYKFDENFIIETEDLIHIGYNSTLYFKNGGNTNCEIIFPKNELEQSHIDKLKENINNLIYVNYGTVYSDDEDKYKGFMFYFKNKSLNFNNLRYE